MSGFTEIQLLGQNVNSYRDPTGKMSFAELLAAVGRWPGSGGCGLRPRIRGTLRGRLWRRIDAVPTLCDHVHLPVQSGSSAVLKAMNARVHARVVSGTDLLDQGGEADDQHDHRTLLSAFRERRRQDFEDTATLLDEVGYDAIFAFKYSPRPNTPAIVDGGLDSG